MTKKSDFWAKIMILDEIASFHSQARKSTAISAQLDGQKSIFKPFLKELSTVREWYAGTFFPENEA